MGDNPQRHGKKDAAASKEPPITEGTIISDVRSLLTNTDRQSGNPETAYNALISEYQDFKKTHNQQQVQQFVADFQKEMKSDKDWLPQLAVAMGYDRLSDKSVFSRLSEKELDALANDKDPLTAMLGKELKADEANIKTMNPNTKQEGGMWVTGWGSHNAPGLGRNDLNAYLDPIESARRARNMGDDLQSGLFDQVANFNKKNPNEDALSRDDFVGYLNTNSKKLSAQDTDRIRRIIESFANQSLNTLATYRDGETLLSKKSIKAGLDGLGPDQP
jgi:hypothetical protein